MATEGPPETQNRVNSKKGYNMIHPDFETQRPPQLPARPVSYVEAKESRKWFSWLIPAFVVANIVMFVVTMYVNDCPKNSINCVAKSFGRFSFQPFKENPLLGPSSATLQKMGALNVDKVVHKHQGWRLISCIWLHAGVFHILANMLSLLVIGIRLEQEFGFVLIGLLYIISGLGGSLMSALFIQANISVGASGALFGLLGSMLSELITNWSIYANKFAAFLTLVIIIAINLAVGILPHVDNFAHIGGFLSGFLIGFVFLIRPQYGWVRQRYTSGSAAATIKSKYKAYQIILWVFSLVLLIIGFTVGLIMLFRGYNANDHCSWCHYLSCIPTSHWSCKNEPASCMITQTGNQLNITCSSNGKSGIYMLPSPTNSQRQGLCSELCN